MKEYYLISEIAKLFGISTDALRNYEKLGLLTPKRSASGYRLFSLKDLYKLNIIRELRQLDFSLPEIKNYLAELSVESTLALLTKEQQLLEQKRAVLDAQLAQVTEQKQQLIDYGKIHTGKYQLKNLSARACVQITEHITRDEEMDFVIKKLQQKHEAKLSSFASLQIGAFLSLAELKQGRTNVYHTVFFVLPESVEEKDFDLLPGTYVSTFYRGSYEQNAQEVAKLYAYCHEQRLEILGEPFELYRIDNRQTAAEAEFLTELQLHVRKTSTT